MAFKDHTGRLYTLAELEGKWTFLFFGYTYCPDICPTTLSMMASVASNLEKEVAGGVQILFVSIDPGRDSPEILGRYLAHFHEDFTGITADEPKTRRFADQFGAMFLRDREGSADNYLMAHASSIYLVDPRANFIAAFSPPHDPATITSQFRQIRRLK
jgi:protein SCO1/2